MLHQVVSRSTVRIGTLPAVTVGGVIRYAPIAQAMPRTPVIDSFHFAGTGFANKSHVPDSPVS